MWSVTGPPQFELVVASLLTCAGQSSELKTKKLHLECL